MYEALTSLDRITDGSVLRSLGRTVRSSLPFVGPARETTTVAIACQGGGSHTAFTAGVLAQLFSELPAEYDVCGLSGASGGAVCATAAWYGLVSDSHDPESVLRRVWDDIAADSLWDRWLNTLALVGSTFTGVTPTSRTGVPTPSAPRRQLENVLAAPSTSRPSLGYCAKPKAHRTSSSVP